jgi:hypothetical protein
MVFKVDAASRRVISKRRVERGKTLRLLWSHVFKTMSTYK